jgi:inner membrane protein
MAGVSAVAAGPGRIASKVAAVGAVLAMLPDADVIGLRLGVDYAAGWGHRGATHSLAIAALMVAALAAIWPPARNGWMAAFLLGAMASHGLLDMATDGGLGLALWWPFDNARLFWADTPIRVSPIGAGFFSARGWETVLSELVWIGLPCAVLALALIIARRISPPRDPS